MPAFHGDPCYSLVQCQFDDPGIVPAIVRALDELNARVCALEAKGEQPVNPEERGDGS
jgi:hypothetical protein